MGISIGQNKFLKLIKMDYWSNAMRDETFPDGKYGESLLSILGVQPVNIILGISEFLFGLLAS